MRSLVLFVVLVPMMSTADERGAYGMAIYYLCVEGAKRAEIPGTQENFAVCNMALSVALEAPIPKRYGTCWQEALRAVGFIRAACVEEQAADCDAWELAALTGVRC